MQVFNAAKDDNLGTGRLRPLAVHADGLVVLALRFEQHGRAGC